MKTKKWQKITCFAAVTGLLFMTTYSTAEACTTVLAGKKATSDGSTMVARNEDMGTAWTKRFVVREADTNDSHFVSKGNGFTIELPKEQLKYTATPEWDVSEGLYEEAGINSQNVGMSATESTTTKDSVLAFDPLEEEGIAEDAMLTVVLPYIESAKEGVERLGKIIEEKGSAESNGVIFSDHDEIWYMETLTGHHWAAVRVPDDKYAVIANTISIQDFDWNDTENYLSSKNLKEFIEENDLADTSKMISIRDIFADTEEDAEYNTPRVWYGQQMLTKSDKKISDTDFALFEKADEPISTQKIANILGSHYEGTAYDPFKEEETDQTAAQAGFWAQLTKNFKQEKKELVHYRPISVPNTMESHILQIRNDVPEAISGIHWLALGVPDTSNYIPFYSSITETPKEYQIGNDQPDDESAYWTYRKTNALAVPYYNEFKTKDILPLQQKVWEHMIDSVKTIDNEAEQISEKTPEKLAPYLNKETNELAHDSLKEYKKLNSNLIKKMTEKTTIEHNEDL
ncbi:C69 family dipeptidase [Pisciglobus halotolerans]|uniref:Dipeptidase n=1 Tax=Pisciglobus halotolerans TaxID=745365 RepID=A0A1I3BSV4_9LACT|nr:C69 family dipeptidase [Pisciglobus halotolerans]SFH65365.1 dipeptidase [Pisciglobus halotolerans]